MRKLKRDSKPVAIYGVAALPFRLIWLIPIPFLLLAVYIFGGEVVYHLVSGNWISAACPGLFIYSFLFVIWILFQNFGGNRLVFFDAGIETQIMGVKGFAHWDELKQFGWKRSGRTYYWGILVDESMIEFKSLLSRFFQSADVFDGIIPLDQFENIPHISCRQIDLERFKKTLLGSDLYYYAPHLFDEAEAKPKHTSA